MKAYPLMPKATALWLVDYTSLTFEQIAEFCGLHILEIQAYADGEVGMGLAPFDCIQNNQLTQEEIDRCQKDPNARLALLEIPDVLDKKKKGGKYTPVSLRKERPDGIAWVLKHHPEITDTAIMRLLGTTKTTIDAIRSKTHGRSPQIKPQHPVTLGLCSEKDLTEAIEQSGEIVSRQNA